VQDTIFSALEGVVGAQRLLTGEADRRKFGQDVSGDQGMPIAVAQPENTEELAALVGVAAAQDLIVVPRGGGMSYSSGYVTHAENALCIDTALMSRILEINEDDMYVTVQAGCTWKTLHEALEPLGLRTPFWGTLSGIKASVCGSLSQNSIFWGTARHGASADSVISFDVVLGNGQVLSTGSAAQAAGSPFFRHYGPDLTGLFTSDTGALGIKATATLRLIPAGAGRAYVSFDFERHDQLLAAMSEVSRQRLVDACFGLDPNLQAMRKKRESLAADVKALGKVVSGQGSLAKGIKEGARVALAGRRFMKEDRYSAHFMIEEGTQEAADSNAHRVREVCSASGGNELENSIPKITRANPFGPLNNMIGPGGERWLPVHVLVPHSKARATFEAIEAFFERHAEQMESHGIEYAYLLSIIDAQCFVIEPVFYWPDALNDLHRETVEDSVLAKINDYSDNPQVYQVVMAMRRELMTIMAEQGGVHLQIGRSYPYQDGVSKPARALVAALKAVVDPDNRINPGSLGL